MLRLCNEFYGKQNDYYFILEAVGKNKTGLGTYNDFSSQHTGNISSSLLYVGSFCMCCQLLIDFITIYTVFALSGCAPTALLNCTQCFVNKVDLQYRNSGCPSDLQQTIFFLSAINPNNLRFIKFMLYADRCQSHSQLSTTPVCLVVFYIHGKWTGSYIVLVYSM